MTRTAEERLHDVLDAIEAIDHHLTAGALTDGIVFDAVRMRLIEIGEAVKALEPGLLAQVPYQWSGAARMRDRITHRYFDTVFALVEATVREDLPRLADAVRRLLARL